MDCGPLVAPLKPHAVSCGMSSVTQGAASIRRRPSELSAGKGKHPHASVFQISELYWLLVVLVCQVNDNNN